LVEVNALGSSTKQEQFSLQFRAPRDAPISQGIYRLEHDRLGALDIFLVPIGLDGNGVRYEAVFTRLFE